MDGKDAHWNDKPESYIVASRKIKPGAVLKIPMAAGGGFAIRLKANE